MTGETLQAEARALLARLPSGPWSTNRRCDLTERHDVVAASGKPLLKKASYPLGRLLSLVPELVDVVSQAADDAAEASKEAIETAEKEAKDWEEKADALASPIEDAVDVIVSEDLNEDKRVADLLKKLRRALTVSGHG